MVREHAVRVQISGLTETITGAQLRAARALLGWSARKLSALSEVSHSAIQRAEKSNGPVHMQARKLAAIRHALEAHGIEFIQDNGLRLQPAVRH